MPQTKTAHQRYEELKRIREPYLRRARECAEVTLPYLFPPEGADEDTDLPTPFQSVGARGATNLASKLTLALYPPNTPFFELSVDDFALAEIAGDNADDARADFEAAMSSVVQAVGDEFDRVGIRNSAFEANKNLIVGGNVLLQVLDNNKARVHQLQNYVVHRDGDGDPVEIILKETISRRAAPDELLQLVEQPEPEEEDSDKSVEETLDLFTWVRRSPSGQAWEVHQEVGDQSALVPDSMGTYPFDRTPWIPLRLIVVDSEDYGRSYAEEYLGDLLSLEKNSQSIVDFSAAAAKVLTFVDPGGITDGDEIADARSGDVLDGNANDVTILMLEKFADFRITDAVTERMESRLEAAFLLMSSIQRSGERVTAEEIRRLAGELEESLGGVYSLLAGEFQKPLVRRVMHNMERLPKLPTGPDGPLNLKVVTGTAAIGRNHDLVKLDQFLVGVLEIAGPEAVAQYLNLGAYMKRRAAALNISIDGMIRSEEEVQEIRQKQQMAEAMQSAAPQLAKAGADASQPNESETGE